MARRLGPTSLEGGRGLHLEGSDLHHRSAKTEVSATQEVSGNLFPIQRCGFIYVTDSLRTSLMTKDLCSFFARHGRQGSSSHHWFLRGKSESKHSTRKYLRKSRVDLQEVISSLVASFEVYSSCFKVAESLGLLKYKENGPMNCLQELK
jgi:hypothetical protein